MVAPNIRIQACGLFDNVAALNPRGQTFGQAHETSSILSEENMAFVKG